MTFPGLWMVYEWYVMICHDMSWYVMMYICPGLSMISWFTNGVWIWMVYLETECDSMLKTMNPTSVATCIRSTPKRSWPVPDRCPVKSTAMNCSDRRGCQTENLSAGGIQFQQPWTLKCWVFFGKMNSGGIAPDSGGNTRDSGVNGRNDFCWEHEHFNKSLAKVGSGGIWSLRGGILRAGFLPECIQPNITAWSRYNNNILIYIYYRYDTVYDTVYTCKYCYCI